MHKVIKDWFTGIDGETHDPARFLWFVGIVAFLIFVSVQLYRKDQFDMSNFAFAYSSLLAAGAAGIKIKESSEPPAQKVTPVVPPTPQAPVQVTVINDDDIPPPPKN